MPDSSEDRYAKYDNFAGPDPEQEREALRRWNVEKSCRHAASTIVSNPTRWIGTPRKAKHGRQIRA